MYQHQEEIVALSRIQDDIALFHGLGSGKTRSVIEAIRDIFNTKKRTFKVLIVGVPAVVYNWKNEILRFSNIQERSIYVCASGTNRDKKLQDAINKGAFIITINYEALISDKIFQVLKDWQPEILVCDECFHKDTLVDTQKGKVKISEIKVGDYVKNCLGYSRVKSVSKKEILDAVRITFNNTTITCSLNHPFLTRDGWEMAKNLHKGDSLVSTNEAMRILSERFCTEEETKKGTSRSLLRDILLSEMEDDTARNSEENIHTGKHRENSIKITREEASSMCRENEITQSYVEGRSQRESTLFSASKRSRWMEAINSMREWVRSYWTRTSVTNAFTWCKMEYTSTDKERKRKWIPYCLQNRSWISRVEIRNRSRWTEPQLSSTTSTRQEERRFPSFFRVESVEIKEQRHPRGHPENYFYDIGVEGHPSFSVNDTLVHNCHVVKNPTAKRSKATYELSRGTFKRFILTGTPILRNMMDIFMQFKILDQGKTFGLNYFAFRAKYFVDKNASWAGKQKHFPLWIPREDTRLDLMNKIRQKAHVVETKDCMELPPYVEVTEYLEMGKNQKKAYEQMRDYFMTFIEENMDKPALATIAPVKALRLLQIAAGHVTQEDGTLATFENPKLDRLMEHLEELTPAHKVIVWTVFKHDIACITTELKARGIKFVSLSGLDNIQEKQASVDAFQKDPTVRVFVGNDRSGSTGINLTQASYSIRYSNSFNLGNYLQSIARNYRGGSQIHERIVNINLSMKDSIDEAVTKSLLAKEDIGKNLVNYIKENC